MISASQKAKDRVTDALHALDLLESRLKGVSETALSHNGVLLDACAYRIGVVGEAISYAKAFSPTLFKNIVPLGFSWDEVVMVRNQFYHQYNAVTAKAVLLFSNFIPTLKLALGNVAGSL